MTPIDRPASSAISIRPHQRTLGNRHVQAAFALLAIVTFTLSNAAHASAALINGDFETGDLTGWDVVTNGPTVTVQDFGGNYKAVIDFDNSDSSSVVFLTQEFTIAGSKSMLLSFDYQLWIHDLSGPGVDVNYTMGGGGPGNYLYGEVFLRDVSLELGPATFSTVLQPGKNWVGFIMGSNVAKANGEMIIDNVQLTPVPEPGTALLMAMGSAIIAVSLVAQQCGTRRRKYLPTNQGL